MTSTSVANESTLLSTRKLVETAIAACGSECSRERSTWIQRSSLSIATHATATSASANIAFSIRHCERRSCVVSRDVSGAIRSDLHEGVKNQASGAPCARGRGSGGSRQSSTIARSRRREQRVCRDRPHQQQRCGASSPLCCCCEGVNPHNELSLPLFYRYEALRSDPRDTVRCPSLRLDAES